MYAYVCIHVNMLVNTQYHAIIGHMTNFEYLISPSTM